MVTIAELWKYIIHVFMHVQIYQKRGYGEGNLTVIYAALDGSLMRFLMKIASDK